MTDDQRARAPPPPFATNGAALPSAPSALSAPSAPAGPEAPQAPRLDATKLAKMGAFLLANRQAAAVAEPTAAPMAAADSPSAPAPSVTPPPADLAKTRPPENAPESPTRDEIPSSRSSSSMAESLASDPASEAAAALEVADVVSDGAKAVLKTSDVTPAAVALVMQHKARTRLCRRRLLRALATTRDTLFLERLFRERSVLATLLRWLRTYLRDWPAAGGRGGAAAAGENARQAQAVLDHAGLASLTVLLARAPGLLMYSSDSGKLILQQLRPVRSFVAGSPTEQARIDAFMKAKSAALTLWRYQRPATYGVPHLPGAISALLSDAPSPLASTSDLSASTSEAPASAAEPLASNSEVPAPAAEVPEANVALESPAAHTPIEAPPVHETKEAPPVYETKEAPPVHETKQAPPVHKPKEAPVEEVKRRPSEETPKAAEVPKMPTRRRLAGRTGLSRSFSTPTPAAVMPPVAAMPSFSKREVREASPESPQPASADAADAHDGAQASPEAPSPLAASAAPGIGVQSPTMTERPPSSLKRKPPPAQAPPPPAAAPVSDIGGPADLPYVRMSAGERKRLREDTFHEWSTSFGPAVASGQRRVRFHDPRDPLAHQEREVFVEPRHFSLYRAYKSPDIEQIHAYWEGRGLAADGGRDLAAAAGDVGGGLRAADPDDPWTLVIPRSIVAVPAAALPTWPPGCFRGPASTAESHLRNATAAASPSVAPNDLKPRNARLFAVGRDAGEGVSGHEGFQVGSGGSSAGSFGPGPSYGNGGYSAPPSGYYDAYSAPPQSAPAAAPVVAPPVAPVAAPPAPAAAYGLQALIHHIRDATPAAAAPQSGGDEAYEPLDDF